MFDHVLLDMRCILPLRWRMVERLYHYDAQLGKATRTVFDSPPLAHPSTA